MTAQRAAGKRKATSSASPGGAVRALHAMAAIVAERQRRIAAAIEEEKRLLARRQRLAEGLH
jgi:hypothetical protein